MNDVSSSGLRIAIPYSAPAAESTTRQILPIPARQNLPETGKNLPGFTLC
jgi:hypothetical protein